MLSSFNLGGPSGFVQMQHSSSRTSSSSSNSGSAKLATRSLMTPSMFAMPMEKSGPQPFSSLPAAPLSNKGFPGFSSNGAGGRVSSYSSHSSYSSSSNLGSDGLFSVPSSPSSMKTSTVSTSSSPIPADAVITQEPGSSYRTYTWKVTQPDGYTTTHWYTGPLGPDRIPPKFDVPSIPVISIDDDNQYL